MRAAFPAKCDIASSYSTVDQLAIWLPVTNNLNTKSLMSRGLCSRRRRRGASSRKRRRGGGGRQCGQPFQRSVTLLPTFFAETVELTSSGNMVANHLNAKYLNFLLVLPSSLDQTR